MIEEQKVELSSRFLFSFAKALCEGDQRLLTLKM